METILGTEKRSSESQPPEIDLAGIEQICRQAKEATFKLATATEAQVNQALIELAALLEAHSAVLLEENRRDVEAARAASYPAAFVDRLTLTPKTIQTMRQGVLEIAELHSRTNQVLEERHLENGAVLRKLAVPLGVIGIIYESRPNVTIDAAALCLKSGNAVVLKGGKESLNSNRFLAGLIRQALAKAELPASAVGFIDSTDRAATQHLLKQSAFIDVLIPRGGYELVQAVVAGTTIPVLYHAEGGARIYVDPSADLDMAAQVILNSKTNRPSTCNTLDTVVVHREAAASLLEKLLPLLDAAGVEVRGDDAALALVPAAQAKLMGAIRAGTADWETEYLSLVMSVKVVASAEEGFDFIRRYSKRHTEGIIAQDEALIEKFLYSIDAAALVVNSSTRLHDGGIFGLGAEMGIATGKLHARGPVGLEELSTYKWVMVGNGQIRK